MFQSGKWANKQDEKCRKFHFLSRRCHCHWFWLFHNLLMHPKSLSNSIFIGNPIFCSRHLLSSSFFSPSFSLFSNTKSHCIRWKFQVWDWNSVDIFYFTSDKQQHFLKSEHEQNLKSYKMMMGSDAMSKWTDEMEMGEVKIRVDESMTIIVIHFISTIHHQNRKIITFYQYLSNVINLPIIKFESASSSKITAVIKYFWT